MVPPSTRRAGRDEPQQRADAWGTPRSGCCAKTKARYLSFIGCPRREPPPYLKSHLHHTNPDPIDRMGPIRRALKAPLAEGHSVPAGRRRTA